jgi:hypothetical protein
MKFWEFGSMRITLPSKVPVIWIAHACWQMIDSASVVDYFQPYQLVKIFHPYTHYAK